MKTKKILALALAAVLLVAVSVAGTFAYLVANTNEVVNEFSTTNITVDLDESDNLNLQIIPGVEITKDPVVTAQATAGVAYWVFVEVKEENWIEETETVDGKTVRKVNYAIDGSWTELGTNANGDKVYYQAVANANGVEFSASVLADNEVTVSTALTKEEMSGHAPKLTFQAFAIQQASFGTDVETAYETVSGMTINN